MIKSSLDWSLKGSELRHCAQTKIETLSNRTQVCRMIDNISLEITQLSKAEVLARRGQRHLAEELLIKVNNDIELVEEFILVAALIG